MSEYESAWTVTTPGYDPDATPKPRKPQRVGAPRAAKESDIEARLYAIQRKAAMDWQEREAC
jgi:hypothetical protein